MRLFTTLIILFSFGFCYAQQNDANKIFPDYPEFSWMLNQLGKTKSEIDLEHFKSFAKKKRDIDLGYSWTIESKKDGLPVRYIIRFYSDTCYEVKYTWRQSVSKEEKENSVKEVLGNNNYPKFNLVKYTRHAMYFSMKNQPDFLYDTFLNPSNLKLEYEPLQFIYKPMDVYIYVDSDPLYSNDKLKNNEMQGKRKLYSNKGKEILRYKKSSNNRIIKPGYSGYYDLIAFLNYREREAQEWRKREQELNRKAQDSFNLEKVALQLDSLRKIQELEVLPFFVINLNTAKKICYSGCDNPNGRQKIHYGNYFYQGPVKNGVPHTDSSDWGELHFVDEESPFQPSSSMKSIYGQFTNGIINEYAKGLYFTAKYLPAYIKKFNKAYYDTSAVPNEDDDYYKFEETYYRFSKKGELIAVVNMYINGFKYTGDIKKGVPHDNKNAKIAYKNKAIPLSEKYFFAKVKFENGIPLIPNNKLTLYSEDGRVAYYGEVSSKTLKPHGNGRYRATYRHEIIGKFTNGKINVPGKFKVYNRFTKYTYYAKNKELELYYQRLNKRIIEIYFTAGNRSLLVAEKGNYKVEGVMKILNPGRYDGYGFNPDGIWNIYKKSDTGWVYVGREKYYNPRLSEKSYYHGISYENGNRVGYSGNMWRCKVTNNTLSPLDKTRKIESKIRWLAHRNGKYATYKFSGISGKMVFVIKEKGIKIKKIKFSLYKDGNKIQTTILYINEEGYFPMRLTKLDKNSSYTIRVDSEISGSFSIGQEIENTPDYMNH